MSNVTTTELEPVNLGGATLRFFLVSRAFGFYRVEIAHGDRVVYSSEGYKPNPNVPMSRWRECLVGFARYDADRDELTEEQCRFWRTYGEEVELYVSE